MDFIVLYSVEQAIVGAVSAARGQILAIHQAHPTANLVVCRNVPGFPVIRTGFLPVGALYGVVMHWEHAGVIRYLGGDLPARRPLPAAIDTA